MSFFLVNTNLQSDIFVFDSTVAVFVAHIYGKRSNLDHVFEACKDYPVTVLEDCAEAFCGFNYTGLSYLILDMITHPPVLLFGCEKSFVFFESSCFIFERIYVTQVKVLIA